MISFRWLKAAKYPPGMATLITSTTAFLIVENLLIESTYPPLTLKTASIRRTTLQVNNFLRIRKKQQNDRYSKFLT